MRTRKEIVIAGKYIVEKKVGKGTFGEIYQGHSKETNQKIAIKFVITIYVLGTSSTKITAIAT